MRLPVWNQVSSADIPNSEGQLETKFMARFSRMPLCPKKRLLQDLPLLKKHSQNLTGTKQSRKTES